MLNQRFANMIRAFAPRTSRGYSWVLLSIVAVLAWTSTAPAQTARKSAASKTDDAAADASKKKGDGADEGGKDDRPKAAEAGDADQAEAVPKKEANFEILKDPHAEAILGKKFSSLGKSGNVAGGLRDVLAMVAGEKSVDRAAIQRFVDACIADLTNSSYIAALMDGGPKPQPKALEIKKAADALREPLERAKQGGDKAAFLTEYNRVLLDSTRLPKVLDNNYFARIEAIIVLGQTGSVDAIPVFVKQLNDPNQSVWVKLWAARGITNVTEGGKRELSPPQAVVASKALIDWLDKDADLPWPAQVRALEALGSLRQAGTPQKQDKQPEFAFAAMKYLADPNARPEVRAMAAWAIGTMRTSGVSKLNLALVGYYVAEVAAVLGDKVDEVFDSNPKMSSYFAGNLLYQLYPALEGQPGVRDAGLLNGQHPNLAGARPFLKSIDDLIKPVAKSSVDLINGPRGKQKDLQKGLEESVANLRSFLQKNPPKDVKLVPGGPAFPVKNNEVAKAAEEK